MRVRACARLTLRAGEAELSLRHDIAGGVCCGRMRACSAHQWAVIRCNWQHNMRMHVQVSRGGVGRLFGRGRVASSLRPQLGCEALFDRVLLAPASIAPFCISTPLDDYLSIDLPNYADQDICMYVCITCVRIIASARQLHRGAVACSSGNVLSQKSVPFTDRCLAHFLAII